jgi:hypothetical protein
MKGAGNHQKGFPNTAACPDGTAFPSKAKVQAAHLFQSVVAIQGTLARIGIAACPNKS